MIKRLDRVKRVPKQATRYFTLFLGKLTVQLIEAGIDTRADILITDTEPGYVCFNIESWNTHKYTLPLDTMKPAKVGKDLKNPIMGWDMEQLLIKIVAELEDWDAYVKLNARIDRSKQIIIGRTTVVDIEGNAPPQGGVFFVEFEQGSTPTACMMAPWLQSTKQEWYGYNYADAVKNALEYQPNRRPVKVTFVRTEKF